MRKDAPGDWFRARREGIDISIRLTPKGGCDRIDGIVSLAGALAALAGQSTGRDRP